MTISEPAANITIDKQVPGYWRATHDNPPINTVHDRMYHEVFDLVEVIEGGVVVERHHAAADGAGISRRV